MWEIVWTEECKNWIFEQDDDTREAILAHLFLLEDKGPTLGRPFADTISGSKISNLKELRVQVKLKIIRIFYVFTSKRLCLLLSAGNKKGNKRFYEIMSPKAEKIYFSWITSQKDNSI